MSQFPMPEDARRAALRKRIRLQREALHPDEAAAAARAACDRLAAAPEFRDAARIAGYVAVRGELDPRAALDAALVTGKSVFLPVVQDNATLRFLPWRPATPLQINRFGIPEPDLPAAESSQPSDLDLVIVPLVAFDRTGARLGTGAGYYDRSFEFGRIRRGVRPLLAGFGYAFQECPALDAAAWDVPLDIVVTDAELIATHRPGE